MNRDPEPRLTLGTLAGGAVFAGVVWLWFTLMAVMEGTILP